MAWIIYNDGKTTYNYTIDGVEFEEKFMYLENAQFKPYITVKTIPDSNVDVPDWYNNQNRDASWFNSYMVGCPGQRIFVERSASIIGPTPIIPTTYLSEYNSLTQDNPFYGKGYYLYYTYRSKSSFAYVSPTYSSGSTTTSGNIWLAFYDKYDPTNGYSLYGKYAGSTEESKFVFPIYLMYSNKTSKNIGGNTQLSGDLSKYGKVAFAEATLFHLESESLDYAECVYNVQIKLGSSVTVNSEDSSIRRLSQKYTDLYYGTCKQQIMQHDTSVYVKVNNSNVKMQSENMKIKVNNAFKPMERMWIKANNIWRDVVNNSDEPIKPPAMTNITG